MESRLILNSWKEIADYMGRGVRTVQRYERDLRLPVHRPAGRSRSAVIAFADEINLWMRKGPILAGNGSHPHRAHANMAEWQRLLSNSELLLKRADTLKIQMGELVRLMQETERRRKIMQETAAPNTASKIVHDRTQTVLTKMSEMSDLMARGGAERRSYDTFPPATNRPATGEKGKVG